MAEPTAAAPVHEAVTRWREVRQSLQDCRFDEVEGRIEALVEGSRRDHVMEPPLAELLEGFSTTDPDLGRLLDEWVAERPGSALARACRARHHATTSHLLRGAAGTSNTTEGQLRGFEELQRRAAADVEAAARLDKDSLMVWLAALRIASYPDVPGALAQALRIDPASSIARLDAMLWLSPKWGGSMEAIDAVVEESRTHLDLNPALLGVESFAAFVAADGASIAGDHSEVEAIATPALRRHEIPPLLRLRAEARWALNRRQEALADADRAVQLAPTSDMSLALRGDMHHDLGQTKLALADYDLALELDPLRPDTRYARGVMHSLGGRHGDAVTDLEIAVRYQPIDENAWNGLGWSLMQLGRREEAEASLTRALALRSDLPNAWFLRGKIRYLRQDAGAFDDLATFVKASAKGLGHNLPRRRAWAERVLAAVGDERWRLADDVPE